MIIGEEVMDDYGSEKIEEDVRIGRYSPYFGHLPPSSALQGKNVENPTPNRATATRWHLQQGKTESL